MPLTSTIETLSRSLLQGMMANATLAPEVTQSATMPCATLEAAPVSAMSDFAMSKKAPFPRGLRLLRHADFERVYKQGRRHFSASMTVFYCPRAEGSTGIGAPSSTGSPCGAGVPAREAGAKCGAGTLAREAAPQALRVGFTVSRALGGAVDRNRMKRRLREAVRLSHPPTSLAADVVINPKKSLLTADFAAILNEVTRAFAVIEQKLSPRSEERSKGPDSRTPEAESRS